MKTASLALLVALVVAVDSAHAVALVVALAAVEASVAVADLVVALEVVEATLVEVASAVPLVALLSTPMLLLPHPTHSQTTLLQAESPATPSTFATSPGPLVTRILSSSSPRLARSSAPRFSMSPTVALAEPV